MTYKEIVDRIKEVVDGHKMVVDFGYGNLSDIKANTEGNESADYPYAFLNPTYEMVLQCCSKKHNR